MKEVTTAFESRYIPQTALVIYANEHDNEDVYISSYEFDQYQHFINEHPLSLVEIQQLAEILAIHNDVNSSCFTPHTILPDNILFFNNSDNGYAVWYTPPSLQQLHFDGKLNIPSGKAHVPALIWKANKYALSLFACKADGRPVASTPLYNAPFFNVHSDGGVCMGTVEINASDTNNLEAFISTWQHYFFDSYFTHLIAEHNPIEGNLCMLWDSLINTNKPFPLDALTATKYTIKNLLP